MVGQNIGKYRVMDRIGRGGMGTVYLAMDETLHREVAIKVLNAELNDPEVGKRFRAEAITVARLSHPGIATIYELFQHEGQWLMVMEFVRGETLERLGERLSTLSPQRTAELCMQALAALAHAHSMGVVHRDLKPANMMITETGSVKIMDFGIARVTGTEHLTSAGFMMGTPAYMAPEQVMGHEIDARADLYAMGVVFYRLTSGKLPFKGDTPFAMAQSQVNDPPTPIGTFRVDLPSWVEQVVVRALAKNPEERFQSAVEFHEAFARCLAGLPMATLYSSSAPTELMMTPPRAMPTGTIQRPVASASLPPLMASPSPADAPAGPPSGPVIAEPAAGRSPTPPSEHDTPTIAAIPQAVHAAASPKVATPSPPADAKPSTTRPAPAKAAGKSAGPSVGLLVGAAVAFVAAIGGVAWLMSRGSAPAPAEPAPVAVETPAPEAPAPAPVDPPPVAPPPASSTAVVTRPSGPGAPPATGSAASSAPARSGAAPAPTATASANTAPSDPALTVNDVRLIVVQGRKTDDREVTLTFGGGQLSIAPKNGGDVVGSMTYPAVLRATYTRARDPRWDATLHSPQEDTDFGGLFRTAKHWIVLQSKDAYLILRLEDSNWRQVHGTIEERIKIPVTVPTANTR